MAVEVAGELPVPVEVLSCDSMAVYRGMDVLAAKPTPDERASVPHHLLDLVDPSEPFTAAEYAARASAVMAEVRGRGAVPMLVGGSGLYFRAAVDGLEFAPTDPVLRERLELEDTPALWERLVRADAGARERIDPRNRRRIVRAVEILELSGLPPSDLRGAWQRRGQVTAVALTRDRAELYRRVEERVGRMLGAGLVEEVRRARAGGLSLTARQAVGVKEVLGHLDGHASPEDVRTMLVRNTKRFVRRQYAWFRADPRITWVDVSELGWDRARRAVRDGFAAALGRAA